MKQTHGADASSENTQVQIIELSTPAGTPIAATRVELRDMFGTSWMGFYTYVVDEDSLADGWRVQALTAFRSLYSRPTAGVLAVLMTCVPDCVSVSSDLSEALIQSHSAYLRAVRERDEPAP